MMPPLVRRCPECGHVHWSRSFTAVPGDGPRLVACPRCHHRFEPIDHPWLR